MSENWWKDQYPKYSLQSLYEFPLFESFKKCTFCFDLTQNNFRESFSSENNTQTYKVFDYNTNTAQKISRSPQNNTWVYEHWFYEKGVLTIWKSWLQDNFEWGNLVKFCSEKQHWKSWFASPGQRSFSKFVVKHPETPKDFWKDYISNWVAGGKHSSFAGEAQGETWVQCGGCYLYSVWSSQDDSSEGFSKGVENQTVFTEKWQHKQAFEVEHQEWNKGFWNWGKTTQKNGVSQWEVLWEGQKPSFMDSEVRVFDSLKDLLVLSLSTLKKFKVLEPKAFKRIQLADRRVSELLNKFFKNKTNELFVEMTEALSSSEQLKQELLETQELAELANDAQMSTEKTLKTQISQLEKATYLQNLPFASEIQRLRLEFETLQQFKPKTLHEKLSLTLKLSNLSHKVSSVFQKVSEFSNQEKLSCQSKLLEKSKDLKALQDTLEEEKENYHLQIDMLESAYERNINLINTLLKDASSKEKLQKSPNNSELQKALEQKTLKISQLKQQILENTEAQHNKHLENIILDKDKAIDELEERLEFMSKYQNLYMEINEEKVTLTNQNQKLKLENKQLREQLDQYSFLSELSSKETKIEQLHKDLLDLQIKYSKLSKEHHNSLKLSRLKKVKKNLHKQLKAAFSKWKKPPEKLDIFKTNQHEYIPPVSLNFEKSKPIYFTKADKAVREEKQHLIDTNIIIQTVQKQGLLDAKPMSYYNLFKFLEDLMDKKFETDKRDLNDKRQPRSMTEFLMEHLMRTFGIEALAFKSLSQLVQSLYKLYQEKHEYGSLFCRLFQLFHPDPVPYALAIYITKARIHFKSLIEKHERYMSNRGAKKSFERHNQGGQAFLSDSMDLLYSMFWPDKESGTLALELIKPKAISDQEYLVYRLCHKMTRMGTTPEAIFSYLDKSQAGILDLSRIKEGLKEGLDLWVSDEAVAQLFQDLDKFKNGVVTKSQFLKFFSLEKLIDYNKNQRFVVTKSTFLTSLIETLRARQVRDAAYIEYVLESETTKQLQRSHAEAIFKKLDPQLSCEKLKSLLDQAEFLSEEFISREAVSKLALRYGVGVFGIKGLMQNLNERKHKVDVEVAEDASKGIVKATGGQKTKIYTVNF